MHTNLKNIFHTRYKAILLLITFGLFAVYVTSGISTVDGWNNEREWLQSKEFKENFEDPTSGYIKGYDESGKEITYQDIEEYRLEELTLFHNDFFTTETITSDTSFTPSTKYQAGQVYWNRYDPSYISMIPLFIFLLGFGLFFIDLKTNFNTLLFSLPFTKKQIFRGKLLYWTIPLMLAIGLGSILHQLIVYLMIPAPYVNATLGQMLYAGLSHWIFTLLAFLIGSFLGVLLGNLVTGPLMIVAGLISLEPSNQFLNNLSNLFKFLKLDSINTFFSQRFGDFSAMAISSLGKTGSTLPTLIVFLLVTGVAFLLAEKIYQNISLENNGKVLTVPRYRKRFFVILAIFTTLYFTFGGVDLAFYYDYYDKLPFLELIFLPAICIISSFVLTYYDEIIKFWNKRYLARMAKNISK